MHQITQCFADAVWRPEPDAAVSADDAAELTAHRVLAGAAAQPAARTYLPAGAPARPAPGPARPGPPQPVPLPAGPALLLRPPTTPACLRGRASGVPQTPDPRNLHAFPTRCAPYEGPGPEDTTRSSTSRSSHSWVP